MCKELERKDLSIVQNISNNEIVIFHQGFPIYRIDAGFLLTKNELEQVIELFKTAQFNELDSYVALSH